MKCKKKGVAPQGESMDFSELDQHKYIKLIEFSLKHSTFTKSDACETSKLSSQEFDFVKRNIFVLSAAQEQSIHSREPQEWKLSPQVFFNYLQFLEFKHAVKTANRAQWTAVAAIVISGLLAIGSIWASVTG
jgi:hypothetical protein